MGYGFYIDTELTMLQAMKTASSNYQNSVQAKTDAYSSKSKNLDISKANDLKEMDNALKLDSSLLNQFEQAFDCDLSSVRIHTGKYADELTKQHSADAITIGTDIYFANGKYAPDSDSGISLLSHELQHAIQNINKERIAFKEDVAKAEKTASKVEHALNSLRLHNLTGAVLSQEKGKLPILNKPGQLINESLNNAFDSIKNSDIEDISSGRGAAKITYDLKMKTGQIINLTKSEVEHLYRAFEMELKSKLTRYKKELDPKAYKEKVTNVIKKLKSAIN